MCSPVLQNIFLLGLGAAFLLIGGILSIVWPIVFNHELREQLVLKDNSRSYNLWKGTPLPMFMEFHMFNWTNPEETLAKHALPHFVERGPYVFREEHKKVILKWNDNGTVTFKQVRTWTFLPDQSVGDLSDQITNVNVIAMTLGNLLKKYVPKIAYPFINSVIKLEHNVYSTKSVRELLFDGYHDVFLDLAKKLEPILKIKLSNLDKFGWFYNRNGSAEYDGVFNMLTGESTLEELGLVRNWKYKSGTGTFPGECGRVGGSSGELWPIHSSSKFSATIFVPDLCSKLDLNYLGTTNVHGASGSVFVGDDSTFNNQTSCFCVGKICHPAGVRDLSPCRFGAPAFVSFPHFYLADPVFREMVTGMEPNPDKHQFDITLHKVTSVPLSVNARLQINILVDKIPGLNFYQKLPKAYLPALWFNQRALVTSELASEFSSLELYSWFEPAFFVLTGLGAIIFFIGLFLWVNRRYNNKSEHDPLVGDNSSS